MKTIHRFGFSNRRAIVAVSFFLGGIFLTALSFAGTPRQSAESLLTKKHSIKRGNRGVGIKVLPTASTTGSSGPGWSIVTSPNGTLIQDNYLDSVTCTSATNCFAVGNYFNGSNYQTLIESWDGTSWSIIPSPNVGPSLDNYLNAVACASATNCFGVGYIWGSPNGAKTLVEQWNGSDWSVVTSPNGGALGNFLNGVTCTSATNCLAVGNYYNAADRAQETLVEQWNGTSWSIVASPNVNAAVENLLNGVTCTSANNCFAVGVSKQSGVYVYQTLIEQWNGNSWQLVSSPNTSTQTNYLYNVACTSETNCFAVGYYFNGSQFQTLIQQWNGSSWSIIASPNSTTLSNYLNGITCTPAVECFAVGYYNDATGIHTLIERWNGTDWKIVPSPNTDQHYNELANITCSSPSNCFSVGFSINHTGGFKQTLVEEYAPSIPALVDVGSRMTHGNAGAFDVDLPLTGKRGVESRNGNGNYSVVFSFVNDVSNCGTTSAAGASVVAGPNSNQCTENLTGVANAQYVTVELDNVVDVQNNTGNVAIQMGVLIGDTNGDGFVDAIDASQTKSQSGKPLGNSNAREDINLDGFLDAVDTSFVKSKSGASLPSSP